jgi:hypothetical protein
VISACWSDRREQVADGVRVVPEQGKFFDKGREQSVFLGDEFPESEHPQSDGHGVILVRARDVDVRPGYGQVLDDPEGLGFQFQFAAAPAGKAQEGRRDKGDGEDRDNLSHRIRDAANDSISRNRSSRGRVRRSMARSRQYERIDSGDPKLTHAYPNRYQRPCSIRRRFRRRNLRKVAAAKPAPRRCASGLSASTWLRSSSVRS